VASVAVESGVAVERIEARAYEVPTDAPESDGTLEWGSTTLVLVEVQGGGRLGLGYTYDDAVAAGVVTAKLADAVRGCDAFSPPAAWMRMQRAVRNLGRAGIAAMAISAVDVALWDLKARLLEVPLAAALPRYRDAVPIYGSGGFTSYPDERLRTQLRGWAEQGIPRVKMKVGRDPRSDPVRLAAAREAVGDDVELMVDANGAYRRKEALHWAERFAEHGVVWFEEPVTSEDLEGLSMVRGRAPAGMSIAAGEYGWDLPYFHAMLAAGAVDVLQADVTRCGGITNMLRLDALCKARNIPFSAHCAPAISAHACCAMETIAHLEYFHDHARVEGLLFDGTLAPEHGSLRPDPARHGLGLELDESAAGEYRV